MQVYVRFIPQSFSTLPFNNKTEYLIEHGAQCIVWAAQTWTTQGSTCVCHLSNTKLYIPFPVCSWELNPGPCVCTASAVLTEMSCEPPESNLLYMLISGIQELLLSLRTKFVNSFVYVHVIVGFLWGVGWDKLHTFNVLYLLA